MSKLNEIKLSFKPKFEQSERIKKLFKANRELALSGRRKEAFRGDGVKIEYDSGAYNDFVCWIYNGPFPDPDNIPSVKNGYEMNAESWGLDYAFMLDNTTPCINPDELIVGEIYWHMRMIRRYEWDDTGEEVAELVAISNELGGYGISHGHTCPDITIGMKQGYGGILKRVRESLALYERLDNPKKVQFLKGLEAICLSNIRYIQRYAALAEKLGAETNDPDEKARFKKIADCCNHIATEPVRNYHEAVQFIQFVILFNRSVGHGDGYGSLDRMLIDYYRKDIAEGTLTHEEAREYMAELFMKPRLYYFAVGGRDINGNDFTNEVSFVAIEAYDLIGDYNNIGVMWHKDMNEDFYNYVCDVISRHGAGLPCLLNYDLIVEANMRNGVPYEHAHLAGLSGCQWYSIPGREYCDQDVNRIVVLKPMQRALYRAIEDNVEDLETLMKYFREECRVTGKAFRNFKRAHDEYLSDIWPEMYTSLLCYGTIEQGLDIVAPRGVEYQFTSVNALGIPNVTDSFYAINELVFKKKMYTLKEVMDAVEKNWEDNEPMRQRFLNVDKFGNDIDDVDALYVRICETLGEEMERLYNQKGQPFRVSLYDVASHVYPEKWDVGATPDGRFAETYFAQGVNPQVGANVRGLIPTANSVASVKGNKFQGAPLQISIQPKFFDGKEEIWKYIRDFSVGYFKSGGVQINMHILNLDVLADAIDNPDNPEYAGIIVRMTGWCSRFIMLSKVEQIEFVNRTNYDAM